MPLGWQRISPVFQTSSSTHISGSRQHCRRCHKCREKRRSSIAHVCSGSSNHRRSTQPHPGWKPVRSSRVCYFHAADARCRMIINGSLEAIELWCYFWQSLLSPFLIIDSVHRGPSGWLNMPKSRVRRRPAHRRRGREFGSTNHRWSETLWKTAV